MDQYQLEIQSIRRTLGRLKADRDADPAIVEEYEAELRNLMALFDASSITFEEGAADAQARRALSELGFGAWTFDNVYSFVYDAAMDTDLGGRDFANVISHTDYTQSLVRALEGEPAASQEADR